MCFFVIIGVRDDRMTELENSVPRGFLLQGFSNLGIHRELPADYRTIAITEGPCSCNLFGRPRDNDELGEPSEIHAETPRRTYAKRGWSERKIARAVEQGLVHVVPDESFVGLRPDVRELLATAAEKIGHLTIVVNMYHGDVETEKVRIDRRIRVQPSDLRNGSAPTDENVLVEVFAKVR